MSVTRRMPGGEMRLGDGKWFLFSTQVAPRWHLRLWKLTVQWWPCEPWRRKLEFIWRRKLKIERV